MMCVRKQLWGDVEHSTNGRYHNFFDSDAFDGSPLWGYLYIQKSVAESISQGPDNIQ